MAQPRRHRAGLAFLRGTAQAVGIVALVAGVGFVVVIGTAGLPKGADRTVVAWSFVAAVVVAALAPAVRLWVDRRVGTLLLPGAVRPTSSCEPSAPG